MRTDEEITSEVIAIVAEIAEVEPERVSPTARLEDLGIDSLDGLRIVAAVEKRYGIVIEEAAIGKIRTMPDILGLVRRHAPEVR
jgi:acyl carrier protein